MTRTVAEPMAVETRTVEVDGRRVRFRAAGMGQPLVLVHGLAGSWRWWSPLLQALAAHRAVYAVDLPRLGPGFPASRLSTWLGRWLDATGLDRVDLAGHSLGGLVAAELAASRPERMRRLVLVSPAGIPCGRSFPTRALSLVTALYDVRGSLPLVAVDALRTGPLAAVLGAAFASTRDLRHELPSVTAPTLLLWGARDTLVHVRTAEEWQASCPNASLSLLPCGHVPMLEAPQDLASGMLSFLDREFVEPSHELSEA
jgi:pimeloyl-ACP methyl ester carboxylesterase